MTISSPPKSPSPFASRRRAVLRGGLLGLAALALASCQSSGGKTASGRPEAVVPASASDTKAAIIGTIVNLGGSLKRDSDFQLVLDKRVDTRSANIFLGAMHDKTVDYRMTFTLLPLGESSTRVIGEGVLVTTEGSSAPEEVPADKGREAKGLQHILDDIARGFSSGYPVDMVVTKAVDAARKRKDIALVKYK